MKTLMTKPLITLLALALCLTAYAQDQTDNPTQPVPAEVVQQLGSALGQKVLAVLVDPPEDVGDFRARGREFGDGSFGQRIAAHDRAGDRDPAAGQVRPQRIGEERAGIGHGFGIERSVLHDDAAHGVEVLIGRAGDGDVVLIACDRLIDDDDAGGGRGDDVDPAGLAEVRRRDGPVDAVVGQVQATDGRCVPLAQIIRLPTGMDLLLFEGVVDVEKVAGEFGDLFREQFICPGVEERCWFAFVFLLDGRIAGGGIARADEIKVIADDDEAGVEGCFRAEEVEKGAGDGELHVARGHEQLVRVACVKRLAAPRIHDEDPPVRAAELREGLDEMKADEATARFLPLAARGDWIVVLNTQGTVLGELKADGFF